MRWFHKKSRAPLRGEEEELSLEDQECGTWYGCRWKAHQPTLLVVEGMWANRNRCAQCGKPIKYVGERGGDWVLDLYIITEELDLC